MAAEDLAHAIVFDFHRGENPQLDSIRASNFQRFMSALAEYQASLRSGEPGASPAGGAAQPRRFDQHLSRATELLTSLTQADMPAGLVYAYLGSISTMLGEPEAAQAYFQKALEREPDDQFSQQALAHIQGGLAARPTSIAAQPLEAPLSLHKLLEQPAIKIVHVLEAHELTRGEQEITVAVLADGSATALAELKRRFSASQSFVPDEPITLEGLGHGTQVSALIAAIAPRVTILPIK